MVDLSKYKDIYVSEAKDHLQKLNDNLLALEKKKGGKDILNELMRSSHTIKGSSATMQYEKTAFLAHVMEDIFDYARNDMIKITPEIINKLFKAVDTLEKSVKSVSKKGKEFNCDRVSKEIKKISGVATEGVGKSKRGSDDTPVIKKSKKESSKKVASKNKKKGANKEIDNADNQLPEIEKITHIKVPVDRLDILMDLMEELLINKMKLSQISGESTKLKEISDQLSRLTSDIQHQVMQVRLVPVEQVFGRFPRMVRDLAKKKGKKIEFSMSGSDMELDRTIVDKLGEPLVHLLRNAVDHGIDESGKIKLDSRRENEFALISVENTGNSIDINKIKESAVRKGIVDDKEIRNFDKAAIADLIFNPRLSTKKKVTETSGRGVGLSVVKNFAEQIGGRVIVDPSLPQGGVRFTLELPLTLAIINALLVEVNGFTFAIPFSNINKSVSVSQENIKSMADQDVAIVGDDYIPLARLDKIFDITKKIEKEESSKDSKDDNLNKEHQRKKETVVIVRRGKDKAGIVVEKLLNEQEIIVKPLPPVLRGIKGSSGSTILGNGKTILIIDVVTLLEEKNKLLRIK